MRKKVDEEKSADMRGRQKRKIGFHSIQAKIMAVSLMIAIGTVVMSLAISFYTEVETLKSITEKYVEQYISHADREFNGMLAESKKAMLSVAMAGEFIAPNLLDKGEEASYEGYQKKKQVNSFLSSFMSQKDYIEDILLIMNNGQVYQAGSVFLSSKELEQPLMKRALSAEALEMIYDEASRILLLCRPASYGQGKEKGTVIVRLKIDRMTAVYDIEFLRSIALYLYLPDGRLFYSNQSGKEISGLASALMDDPQGGGRLVWKKKPYYYIRYVSDASHMLLAALIPQKVLLKDAENIKYKFLLIGIAASASAISAAAYLSKRICADLKRLSKEMEAVRSGDLGARTEHMPPDEIGTLSDAFNIMMDRIEGLIEEVRLKERLKREAEQDVLASQIEPHFLYNSIDSIQYVAHRKGEAEIERAANALSELLRSVLSNHDEFITLWEEKDYIEAFLNIERFKYQKPFELHWDVEEELWTYPVPKLLLQPVVENALIHGISLRESGGKIHVKIYRQQDRMVLKVMDNGKGMSGEKLKELRSHVKQDDKPGFRHIGISNVFHRIQLIYGDACSTSIESCEGIFTCVELRIPLRGDEDVFDGLIGR